MRRAFSVIKNRRYKNPVTAVFLLSDGLDEGAELKVRKSLQEYNIQDYFTIDTFGLGHEHCPQLMVEIAKLGHGAYYNIEEHFEVDECFADAIGGIMSVVAENVKIDLTTAGNLQLVNVYGDHWGNQLNTILLNTLITGGNKDFMAEFAINNNMNSNDPPQITVNFQAFIPGTQQTLNNKIVLPLPTYQEIGLVKNLTEDQDVLTNLHRVQAAQAFIQAHDLATTGQKDKAVEKLKRMINNINQCEKSDKTKLNRLLNDLQEVLNACQSNNFNQKRHKLVEKYHAHMNQKSHGEGNDDQHSNMLQKRLIMQMQQKKNRYGEN